MQAEADLDWGVERLAMARHAAESDPLWQATEAGIEVAVSCSEAVMEGVIVVRMPAQVPKMGWVRA
jgi:hypothetical protein